MEEEPVRETLDQSLVRLLRFITGMQRVKNAVDKYDRGHIYDMEMCHIGLEAANRLRDLEGGVKP